MTRVSLVYTPKTEEEIAARVKAIEAIMIEKGLMSEAGVNKFADLYENEIGPHLGAKVVARAWTDPAFKQRLLANTTSACNELGVGGLQGEHMVALECTDSVHHVIVCTLCSCYPWPVLGLPPNWYKSMPYRARVVREPRLMLREDFHFDLPAATEIRVWDSNSEIRYWVLPKRPDGTDHLSEDQLAALVTRDSLIGTGPAKSTP
ncbi:nitrile hydratase subunit alpha [Stutzerimonas stutzeri]|jgi:nitrile hydratase|uniref:nitrile hydratase subunit alpha n=1 Tax=Pseudomonadota TaxID=1224 RepID=UPI001594576C|nr:MULTISPECIES: nitrile hydratase subunit alpha [Pseudomonadota]UFP37801.1 nitrile hydratase subunit alpha [Stutzerimonas stutzeri]UUC82786.1 nitrile hydratase subunit alpha [Stutzerimonas stutzeri]